MTYRGKAFVGALIALCLCLAIAAVTTFWDHGPSDLTITDAALPTIAPDGDAAPSGVSSARSSSSTAARSRATRAPRTIAAHTGSAPVHKNTPTRTAKSAPALATAATARATPTVGRVVSAKKGAAIWKADGITSALTDSGVSWFYNWSPNTGGVAAPKGVQFVPMMWGADSVDAATLAAAKKSSSVLLGFNEPDFASQSNVSVSKALELWPQLQATGMRLGSPAVASGAADPGKWLDQFMTGATARGLRVDFITLHWYGSDFDGTRATAQLRSYVEATYARYHKPIWITEYALMNWGSGAHLPSASVQADFVTKSTAMLQSLSYVERYAWFALPTATDGTAGTGLYRDGVANASGRAYRAAG